MLVMHNTKYAVEVAHNVSQRKRKEIVERCEQLGLYMTNKFARVKVEEA
jgi:large subunit ribosomal protein L32e